MLSQIACQRRRKITKIASVRLFIRMGLQMWFQTACPSRCIFTLITSVRLFSSVSFQMSGQIAIRNTSKVALVTLFRFFPKMSFQMYHQITCIGTCITTFVAFDSLLQISVTHISGKEVFILITKGLLAVPRAWSLVL